MKKLLLIILICVYSFFAVGINLHKHFCGGELAFSEFVFFSKSKTCGCPPDENNSCCKDIHQYLKVKDNHKVNSTAGFNPLLFACIIPVVDFEKVFKTTSENIASTIFEWPPGSLKIPIYIFLLKLLI